MREREVLHNDEGQENFGNNGSGWLQEDGVYKDRNRKCLSLAR